MRTGTVEFRFVGWRKTYDLTVSGANHYVSGSGLCNSQTWIGCDEVNQFVEEQYFNINGRLRSSDPVLMNLLKTRCMCNPTPTVDSAVKDQHWVRNHFVAPYPSGRKTIRTKLEMSDGSTEYHTRIYLPAKLTDNPDPNFVKSYEKTLRSRPPHIRKALLEGDWWVSADSFFAEAWQSALHVIKPFKVPADWPVARAMDWGFKTPGVVGWFAQDPDGNLICINEFYFSKMQAKDVAVAIRAWEEKRGLWDGEVSAISGPADTQLWEQRGESGLTKAQEMAEKGVFWVKADKRSRERNAEIVYDRLTDHFEGTTLPGLVFFDTCSKCIEVMPTIGTDKNNPNAPAKGGDDHCYDMVSYMCAYASQDGLGMPYFEEDEPPEDIRGAKRGGSFGYGGL